MKNRPETCTTHAGEQNAEKRCRKISGADRRCPSRTLQKMDSNERDTFERDETTRI